MSFYRKVTSHHIGSVLHLFFPHHVDPIPWGSGLWVRWLLLKPGMLPIIRVGVVGEIFPQPLMWLLRIVIPRLVPTPFCSPLLIVELFFLLCCPFHIHLGVIHVFVRGLVSYQHIFFEPSVTASLEPVHSQLLISYMGRGKAGEFYELGGVL